MTRGTLLNKKKKRHIPLSTFSLKALFKCLQVPAIVEIWYIFARRFHLQRNYGDSIFSMQIYERDCELDQELCKSF